VLIASEFVGYRHRCRNRLILGVQRIFCPNFPKKLLFDKLSPYKFSIAVGT